MIRNAVSLFKSKESFHTISITASYSVQLPGSSSFISRLIIDGRTGFRCHRYFTSILYLLDTVFNSSHVRVFQFSIVHMCECLSYSPITEVCLEFVLTQVPTRYHSPTHSLCYQLLWPNFSYCQLFQVSHVQHYKGDISYECWKEGRVHFTG